MKILCAFFIAFTLSVNVFAQNSKETELLNALASMDSAKVQELVKSGMSLSSEKVAAFVMLIVQKAAFSDNIETTNKMLSRLEFFVSQGGDINIKIKTAHMKDMTIFDTPLTYITKVEKNCPDTLLITMRKLISLGADINANRVTTYASGTIYESSTELNRYNYALTCYEKVGEILKNASNSSDNAIDNSARAITNKSKSKKTIKSKTDNTVTTKQ